MRKIGFLLIIVGVGLAYLYPLFQEQFTGKEFARERIFDRTKGGWQNGWREVDINLTEANNPVRIRLIGHVLSGNYFLNNTLPLQVNLSGANGTVLSTDLQINARENQNESVTNERTVQIATTEFGVIEDGIYRLSVTSSIARDVNLNWMDAIFVSNVTVRDESFRNIGLGLMMGGLLMVMFGRKRRRLNAPNRVAEKSAKKPSRWGRQK
ncbi:MAG: hypothetical protein WBD01_10750 [Salaquimonas sp.]